jgi:hypothetical protein
LLRAIQTVEQAEDVSAFGAALGSPAEWPGAFYDAVAEMKRQERATTRAFDKARDAR